MTKPEEEVIKGVSEEEQDSPSDRLHSVPDEVLHLILSKITDPKTLLISSLISNRFASILSLSHSLSLQFPIPIPYPKYPSTNPNLTSSNPPNTTTRSLLSCLTFPFRFLHQITAPKPPPRPSSEPNSCDDLFLRLANLLRRFNGVRSLRIELPCSCRNSDEVEAGFSTVFKWKAKFGLRFEIFSFLSPKSVTKIEDDLEEDDDEEGEVDGDYLIEHTHYEFYGPGSRAISSHRLMLLLIARHPNLRSVEIVESAKHGGLKLEGEELIRVRNALDSTPEALGPSHRLRFPSRLKIWYVPRMELSSGFVMKKVTLVVCRGKGVGANRSGEGEVDDNGDALDGGFEGDGDGIFGEALAEILTKHRFKARCYPKEEDEDAW